MRFEPSGFTGNPDVPIAKSIVDYIFRWLGLKFLPKNDEHVDSTMSAQTEQIIRQATDSLSPPSQMALPMQNRMDSVPPGDEKAIFRTQADSPLCHVCGSITIRNGSCYACPNCGATTGCS